jgi:hypothetical protein
MDRFPRYAIALLVGAGVTGGVAFFQPRTAESAILLAGIAVVYTVGTAIALSNWSSLRNSSGPSWVSGAFTGVSIFGCLMLMDGSEPTPNFAATALGFGLAWFGFVAGVAFENGRETSS